MRSQLTEFHKVNQFAHKHELTIWIYRVELSWLFIHKASSQ